MVPQTESGGPGSRPSANGPALAILTTAPRPGLVLQGLCPPLRAAEASALQTAWLKHIAQELPGIAVFLFGRPADAMPMLRYFAGPGVELREWPVLAPNGRTQDWQEAAIAVARDLFAQGFGPVLVRAADAPEPTQATLLACAAAAQNEVVMAPDQRGAPWLLGWPSLAHLQEPAATRRGPWARTVQNELDLTLLLHERAGQPGAQPAVLPGALPTLPVRNLQAALQYYETVLGARLLSREEHAATVGTAEFTVRLVQRGPDFTPNGLFLPCATAAALRARLGAEVRINPGDELATQTDGGIGFSIADQDGNRLTFGTGPTAP